MCFSLMAVVHRYPVPYGIVFFRQRGAYAAKPTSTTVSTAEASVGAEIRRGLGSPGKFSQQMAE